MGTTYRSTLVNLLFESISMFTGLWTLHGPFCHTPCYSQPCCLLSHTGMVRPLISETAAGHQFSIQIMHMHCTQAPLPVWKFLPLPKSSNPFQSLPFFMKCRGPVLLCSFLQVRIHCNFYTSWSLVLWHSFILRWVLSLASGLVRAKWCCPLPQ